MSAGLGGMAANLMDPVIVVTSFVIYASMVLGVTFLFAAFLRYMQYRVNPLASPLSTVVLLIIMGIVLLVLPMGYKLL